MLFLSLSLSEPVTLSLAHHLNSISTFNILHIYIYSCILPFFFVALSSPKFLFFKFELLRLSSLDRMK